MTDDLAAAKSLLRHKLLKARASVDPATALDFAHLPMDLAVVGKIVAGYIPFKTETDPRPLLRHLAGLGAKLCFPRTPAKAIDSPLTFHTANPDEPADFKTSAWGVMEPVAHLPQVEPDVLLIPLLGFDRAGHRLGQGQGHYDRTLAALRASKTITAVGVGYSVQEVPHMPAEPHDQRLDWILTENEAYRVPS